MKPQLLSNALLLRALAMTVIALPTSAPSSSEADEPANTPNDTPQQSLIRISKETTGLTQPLDEEGFIDYVEAVNQIASAGVTPENNYEVVVRRTLSFDDIEESFREEYFSRLQMTQPRPETLTYQDYISFVMQGRNDPQLLNRLYDEHNLLTSQPWTAADHPEAAKWVAELGADLDKLVEGSKREKYYTPYLTGGDPEEAMYPRMIAILLPSIQQQREVARGLMIRAMGRIGEEDLEGAWSDIQAMHRVARHASQGFTLIESLVGVAIDAMACQAEQFILNSPLLTDDQTKRFFSDLKSLKPFPPIADKIDFGERYMGLDAVISLARHNQEHGLMKMLKLIGDLSAAGTPNWLVMPVSTQQKDDQSNTPRKQPSAFSFIDWNTTLIFMNEWYDKIVAASREPDYEKRMALFETINRDLEALASEVNDTQNLLGLLLKSGPRKGMGETIGRILVALLIPAIDAARSAEDQCLARLEVMKLSFALELHRREEGSLPNSLNDLIPEYVKSIALDPLSGKPLTYQAQGEEFLLYSVGRNGVNDDGRTHRDADLAPAPRPPWDDISVRTNH